MNAFDFEYERKLEAERERLCIFVDDRERTIPASSYKHIGLVKKMRLRVGDLCIKSKFQNHVVIESKTLYDLLSSYSTNRLEKQLSALQDCSYDYCFLFVCENSPCSNKGQARGRTHYSSSFKQRSLKYLDQVPLLYPRITVEIFEQASDVVKCVQRLFTEISSIIEENEK